MFGWWGSSSSSSPMTILHGPPHHNHKEIKLAGDAGVSDASLSVTLWQYQINPKKKKEFFRSLWIHDTARSVGLPLNASIKIISWSQYCSVLAVLLSRAGHVGHVGESPLWKAIFADVWWSILMQIAHTAKFMMWVEHLHLGCIDSAQVLHIECKITTLCAKSFNDCEMKNIKKNTI